MPYLYQILVDLDKTILEENKKLLKYENFAEFYRIFTSYLDQDIIDIGKLSELSRGNIHF